MRKEKSVYSSSLNLGWQRVQSIHVGAPPFVSGQENVFCSLWYVKDPWVLAQGMTNFKKIKKFYHGTLFLRVDTSKGQDNDADRKEITSYHDAPVWKCFYFA